MQYEIIWTNEQFKSNFHCRISFWFRCLSIVFVCGTGIAGLIFNLRTRIFHSEPTVGSTCRKPWSTQTELIQGQKGRLGRSLLKSQTIPFEFVLRTERQKEAGAQN